VLLLVGRGCSILVNLATQIVTIRYLTKLDYGVFAYALSVIEVASLAAAFGMDKTLARFGAIYHEQRDLPRLTGALRLSFGAPVALGLLYMGGVLLMPEGAARALKLESSTLWVLAVTAPLVPINAFASSAQSVFTVFGEARTVFIRKHLFGPLCRLITVLTVIALGGGLPHLAAALLLTGVCGAITDIALLIPRLRGLKWVDPDRARQSSIPFREFLSYSVPLLSSDAAYLARGTLVVVLLGTLAATLEAATFRAVLPVVRLNELVLVNFSLMFIPLASRLYAKGEAVQLAEMHRRTTVWIMVLTFPVFAACVALARPPAELLFGREYSDSGRVLAVLAIGYYVQAAFGFNSRLLKVLGFVRPVFVLDVIATAVSLMLATLFIPRWGASGAAAAVSAGMIVHATLKWWTVRRLAGLGRVSGSYVASYLAIAICSAALVAEHYLVDPDWANGSAMIALTTFVVLVFSRPVLDVAGMFPELHRLPAVSRWFSAA
jgi:O-antigen/teichoic acid export membrane protein